jgi:hypothetical protein
MPLKTTKYLPKIPLENIHALDKNMKGNGTSYLEHVSYVLK